MIQKPNLLLDVDEVICFEGFLDAVNDFLGTTYQIDDFTDYFIDEVTIPKEQFQEFQEFIRKRNLYETAKLLPGAQETIAALRAKYEIFFLSSCVNPFDLEGSGKLFQDKYNYLRSTLPDIHPGNYIFTSAKHLIHADVQIDDLLKNLNDNNTVQILFPSYHNRDVTEEELAKRNVIRAGTDWRHGWEEVGKILLDEKSPVYTLKRGRRET